MARRGYSVTKRCVFPGCTETGFQNYESRRSMRESTWANSDWTCCRHSKPDEVLSPESLVRVTEHVCSQNCGRNYWNGRSGFEHGPGFKAYADDFPVGTVLRITAEIVLPEST